MIVIARMINGPAALAELRSDSSDPVTREEAIAVGKKCRRVGDQIIIRDLADREHTYVLVKRILHLNQEIDELEFKYCQPATPIHETN